MLRLSVSNQELRRESMDQSGILIPSCEYILRHILPLKEEHANREWNFEAYKAASQSFSSRKLIKTSIDNCWGKLDDYYKILDTLPAYIAAPVLHAGTRNRLHRTTFGLERGLGSIMLRRT